MFVIQNCRPLTTKEQALIGEPDAKTFKNLMMNASINTMKRRSSIKNVCAPKKNCPSPLLHGLVTAALSLLLSSSLFLLLPYLALALCLFFPWPLLFSLALVGSG